MPPSGAQTYGGHNDQAGVLGHGGRSSPSQRRNLSWPGGWLWENGIFVGEKGRERRAGGHLEVPPKPGRDGVLPRPDMTSVDAVARKFSCPASPASLPASSPLSCRVGKRSALFPPPLVSHPTSCRVRTPSPGQRHAPRLRRRSGSRWKPTPPFELGEHVRRPGLFHCGQAYSGCQRHAGQRHAGKRHADDVCCESPFSFSSCFFSFSLPFPSSASCSFTSFFSPLLLLFLIFRLLLFLLLFLLSLPSHLWLIRHAPTLSQPTFPSGVVGLPASSVLVTKKQIVVVNL